MEKTTETLFIFPFYRGEGRVFRTTGILSGKEKLILQLVGNPKLEDGSFSDEVSCRQFIIGEEDVETIEVYILGDLETKSIGQIQTALIGYEDASQGLSIPSKFEAIKRVG